MTAGGPNSRSFPQLAGCNVELLTDLYQLTMGASYLANGITGEAAFELFTRRMPPDRNFLMVAGVEDAIDFLERLRLDDDAIAYLRALNLFPEQFLAYLEGMRFTGDVWAMPEGELFFPDEPVLRVTAPIIEAQFVETFLLNLIGFQSLIASKAARVTLACAGRPYSDFSARRDHGQDAALLTARASYIAGADSTSNVQAGQYYGLKLSGTMAHSYVLSFDREVEAFIAYLRSYPNGTTLLIDTHDTIEGAQLAIQAMEETGIRARAVRIDSGDLLELSRGVRKVLDNAGYEDVQIVVSGDLDEWRIAEMLAAGAPIDGFGVGTQLGTGGDAPSLGVVYKLVADEHGPKMKHSPGKATLPGAKQVYRQERAGRIQQDILALADEPAHEGRPLLEPLMRGGRRLREREPLTAARARAEQSLAKLPEEFRSMREAASGYPVRRSDALEALRTNR